jgi:hypothetical protein
MIDHQDELQPEKPDIITSGVVEVVSFYDGMNPDVIIPVLLNGEYVLIEDYYHNGLEVLKELRETIRENYRYNTFQEEQQFRSTYRDASHRLLLMVRDGSLVVKKAPEIGWFEELYPEESEFLISFPDVQGLNSSWQWYTNGLEIEILDMEIYPYYGVYFPTRFDHLELFDEWLQDYTRDKLKAIDVGIGSGILSFQLLQHGFCEVVGTDINKNAILGVAQEASRLGYEDRLVLKYGDLFADYDTQAELIVFNPPWLLSDRELDTGIDRAIYYKQGLFPRFFREAKKYLAAGGRLAILFSNLGEVVEVNQTHPIRHELITSDRFEKIKYLERKVEVGSNRTKRKNWREDEKVELWILQHKE